MVVVTLSEPEFKKIMKPESNFNKYIEFVRGDLKGKVFKTNTIQSKSKFWEYKDEKGRTKKIAKSLEKKDFEFVSAKIDARSHTVVDKSSNSSQKASVRSNDLIHASGTNNNAFPCLPEKVNSTVSITSGGNKINQQPSTIKENSCITAAENVGGFKYITSVESAEIEVARITRLCSQDKSMLILDCEGINLSAEGELTLLQVAFSADGKEECTIFDVKQMCGVNNRLQKFKPLKKLLENDIVKVVHDVHMDAAAINQQFSSKICNVIDTQLVLEYFNGKMLGSIGEFLDWCNVPRPQIKKEGRKIFDDDPKAWGLRPLPIKLLEYAAEDVRCLLKTIDFWKPLIQQNIDTILKTASDIRCNLPPLTARRRAIGFGRLPETERSDIQSWELLSSIDPKLVNYLGKTEVTSKIDDLLDIIPQRFRDVLHALILSAKSESRSELTDIIFEVGRHPYAYFGQRNRVHLSKEDNDLVTRDMLKKILDPLDNKFGADNRAGIDGSLHRISAIRSKSQEIYSLTLRVGRVVHGSTSLVEDILNNRELSVLIMGSPGSGKTTVIREMAKYLSENEDNVIVVDTSNEICGDGIVPHPSVGMARRMMVPKLEMQANVLIEAVQNHTPDVIICDEIGRPAEVDAMQTVKERGVRVIASAHGNLRSLVANNKLCGLIGGVETVTVGDGKAYRDQSMLGQFSKVRQQRAGSPVFDVVIELKPKEVDKWTIILGVEKAVDKILSGKSCQAQIRRRDADSGLATLELVQA